MEKLGRFKYQTCIVLSLPAPLVLLLNSLNQEIVAPATCAARTIQGQRRLEQANTFQSAPQPPPDFDLLKVDITQSFPSQAEDRQVIVCMHAGIESRDYPHTP